MRLQEFVASHIVAGYGSGTIVKDVTVSVRKAQMAVILGPNGAGKSTLLKAIVGLVPRTGGTVTLNSEDVSRLRVDQLNRRGVAYVPQLRNVFYTLTVRENLEMGGYSVRSGVKERIEELLQSFPNLRKAMGRAAGTLSGGERSLLALARGLMTRPDVLLIDEPTAGLSPQSELLVWDHLEQIRQDGVAMLVVEQNVNRALESADWAYVMVLGETRLQGNPADLGSEALASLFIGGTAEMPGQQRPASAR